jgi:hypothetical protein
MNTDAESLMYAVSGYGQSTQSVHLSSIPTRTALPASCKYSLWRTLFRRQHPGSIHNSTNKTQYKCKSLACKKCASAPPPSMNAVLRKCKFTFILPLFNVCQFMRHGASTSFNVLRHQSVDSRSSGDSVARSVSFSWIIAALSR